jgi:cell division septum initiation protein DivIVA
MSQDGTGSRAADIAARQVESIVAAAEATARQLEEEAARQADQIRKKGRTDAQRELESARKDAKKQIEEAERESAQLREQTRRQMEGRVAAADEAATQVLEEARTLSSGLRHLGASLQDQGERILREVQGAHKRMQADLRVGPPDDDLPPRRAATRSRRLERSAPGGEATPEEREALERAAAELRGAPRRRPRRERDNPFDDLDVPSWVER